LPFAEPSFLGPSLVLLPLADYMAVFIAVPTAFLVKILTTVVTTACCYPSHLAT
jgi:hypothetical protein